MGNFNITLDNKTPLMLRIEANTIETLDASIAWPHTTRREHLVAMADYYDKMADLEWNDDWREFYALVSGLYLGALVAQDTVERLGHYLDGLVALRERRMREGADHDTLWNISTQIVDVKARRADLIVTWF